jgi:DNA-binding NarL/FixJ family response regulator
MRTPRDTTEDRKVRILLVDDHELVRSGLRTLLGPSGDLVVVGEAGTAEECLRKVVSDEPDLVVLDVRLPDGSGVAVCREITTRHPQVKVLILTSYADEGALVASRRAGASGYILKRLGSTDIVSTIRRVAGGEVVFDEGPMESDRGSSRSRPNGAVSNLSGQEMIVARYIARGLTNREIASRMCLADKTVKNYVSNVLTKLGATRRSQAAACVAQAESEADRLSEGWPQLPDLLAHS